MNNELENNLKTLEKKLSSLEKYEKPYVKDIFDNWHSEILPDIFSSEGRNISLPFKAKKNGAAGIHSKNTYSALMRKGSFGKIKIINFFSCNKIVFGFDGENAKYINVNLGIPNGFIAKEASSISEKIKKYIELV